ncbi:TraE/TraK family type IV conjugative transfer system protein [Burkholderia sp. MBR-1]|uniref:TraE/TraK family type IV conjugative transfer system protein n=1 Tax=Burkholderia sp. MBR-1 TaxID=2732364 RepID=UPI0015EF8C88|nr:TraE/TraK family type IV conjugative transfer system protein [Burkholderia sp. MBR-1]QMI49771.1 sex pilus assembly protein TraE [Burkholderia sp. MBR-1]
MNLKRFKLNWDTMESLARSSMILNLILGVGLLMAIGKILQMHERIVLTPPHLTEKAEIAWNAANEGYMKPWGLFVASMLGSITPGTSTFIRDALEPFFDPAIWPQISTQIMSINDDPSYTRTGTINVFTPKDLIWEPGTQKIFVHGTLATTAYRNTTIPLAQFDVTYEMVMQIRRGLPMITGFTSYIGMPRTLKWRLTHAAEVDALEKNEKKRRQNSIIPQDADLARKAEEAESARDAAGASAAAAASAPSTSGAAAASSAVAQPASGAHPTAGATAAVPPPAATSGEKL